MPTDRRLLSAFCAPDDVGYLTRMLGIIKLSCLAPVDEHHVPAGFSLVAGTSALN